MYVYGILASLAFSIGSNVPDSWSVGFLTSTVVTLLVMFRFASWLKDYAERKLCILNVIPFKCLSNIIIGLCIAGMCFTRICGVYRDAPLNQLNRRINCGPAKGLYSTEEHVNQYNRVIHMLDEIENMIPNSNSHIFFSKLLPWAYLCTDFKYGTPTSWRHPLDDLRVMQYYDIHPEKAPDIIVKFSPEIGGYRNSLFSEEREGEQTPNANSENISQFSKYGSYSLCEIGYTDIADIWVK